MLFRNCPWTLRFLQDVWTMGAKLGLKRRTYHEQVMGAFARIYPSLKTQGADHDESAVLAAGRYLACVGSL
jgi:hypothetical protein